MSYVSTDRYTTQAGARITVQIPKGRENVVIEHVTRANDLIYGDYAGVSYASDNGVQRFRSLGTGRNMANAQIVEVPSVELSFFVGDQTGIEPVLRAIYDAHPYEEPVIYIEAVTRALHRQGLDNDNPNRFWNLPKADWVPTEFEMAH